MLCLAGYYLYRVPLLISWCFTSILVIAKKWKWNGNRIEKNGLLKKMPTLLLNKKKGVQKLKSPFLQFFL